MITKLKIIRLLLVLVFLPMVLSCSFFHKGTPVEEKSEIVLEIEKVKKRIEKERRWEDERNSVKINNDIERKKRMERNWLLKGRWDAEAKLKGVEHDIKRMKIKRKDEMKYLHGKLREGVDQIYRDAVELYRMGSYELAKGIFVEVEDIWPDYKLTRNYLSLIEVGKDEEAESFGVEEEQGDTLEFRTLVISDSLDYFEE